MNDLQAIIYGAIATALFFDFINGFHDSANSVATVIGTKVLKPIHAVGIAALANFAGPFVFGTAVCSNGWTRNYTTRIFYCIRNPRRLDRSYHLGSYYLVFWTSVIKQSCSNWWFDWLCTNCRWLEGNCFNWDPKDINLYGSFAYCRVCNCICFCNCNHVTFSARQATQK